MKVLMVSWEYPPLVVGGLAAHVDGLARALARQGHEVVVLTLHHEDVPDDAVVDGVRVLRARADLPWLPPENFIAQMASANHRMVQLTTKLGGWRPDVDPRPRLARGLGRRHARTSSTTCPWWPPSTPRRRVATGAPSHRASPPASTPSSGGSPTRPTG